MTNVDTRDPPLTLAGLSGWKRAVALLLTALLVASWTTHITTSRVDKDSAQSVLMAVNLARTGVMSLDEAPPYTPSDYREPLPIAVSAVGVRVIDAILGPAETQAYFSGERLRYLKFQNILWLGLVCVGVFWAVNLATGSAPFSFAGLLLAGVVFSANSWAAGMLDDLYTDLPGGAVLVLASSAFAAALTRRRARDCWIAGLLFGALVLIKAAVLYVFVGLIGLLGCVFLLYRSRVELRSALQSLGLISLGLLVVVLPWMTRNWVAVGSFQVAQRGGVVLMVRAVKDLMTPEEYLGSFYVWAPGKLREPVGRLLGFGPQDLQRGGRLQHLNRSSDSNFAEDDIRAEQQGRPDQAIAYYRKGRAERIRLQRELAAAHTPHADVAADRLLQKEAMGIIMAHPLKHLAATIPFLWRGATFAFPMLLVGMVVALHRRRYDCALLALPALGLILFYALLSHFISRYSLPVRPVLVALAVIAAKSLWDMGRARFAPSRH